MAMHRSRRSNLLLAIKVLPDFAGFEKGLPRWAGADRPPAHRPPPPRQENRSGTNQTLEEPPGRPGARPARDAGGVLAIVSGPSEAELHPSRAARAARHAVDRRTRRRIAAERWVTPERPSHRAETGLLVTPLAASPAGPPRPAVDPRNAASAPRSPRVERARPAVHPRAVNRAASFGA